MNYFLPRFRLAFFTTFLATFFAAFLAFFAMMRMVRYEKQS
jgi:ABC-type phosphate/phosphonate transport system permease subunit